MAEQNNIFNRLRRLFRNSIVVRKTSDNRLVVKDVDFSQVGLTSNFIDRYTKLMGTTAHASAQNSRNAYEYARRELFRDYELMDTDPIISSALDIYSDESILKGPDGQVLKIKTNNAKLYKILHNLFYNILNIEFNLWSWIRNLTKYGDFFLFLDIMDKYGIVNVRPMSPYEVSRLEDHDPSNPKLVQYELIGDTNAYGTNKKLYENYEIGHFRLLTDSNYLPYGKSTLEGARRVWKQLTLMEDAMLIHRIMRAPEKRIFKIDIGNIPPNEVDNFMQKIINKMKKIPVIDQNTGEYNLRYNVESVTEDYYLPVRGSDSGTEIETLPGLTNDSAIDDIEYLRNKLMAALKVPKAFLGYEEGIGAKATLAAEDVRFARTIERFQKIVASELEKIAIIHLYVQGFEDHELLDFELELSQPSMIHEQEKLELLERQIAIARDSMDTKIFSREWVYNKIFDLNDHEKSNIFNGIIEDRKQNFRMEQIETEGNDPATSEEAVGEVAAEPGQWGGSEKGPQYSDVDYGKATSKDLRDAGKYEPARFDKPEFKGGSPLYPGKGSTIVKKESVLDELKLRYDKDVNNAALLSEGALLDDGASDMENKEGEK